MLRASDVIQPAGLFCINFFTSFFPRKFKVLLGKYTFSRPACIHALMHHPVALQLLLVKNMALKAYNITF